jgi:predicted PurR-regulated permease PerM
MEIHESLSKRAGSARRSAWFSVSLIVSTVFAMIFFFYIGGSGGVFSFYPEFAQIEAKINESAEILKESARNQPDLDPAAVADLEKMKLELQLKQSELDLKRTELEQSSADARRLASTITDSVTKIGAVLIALYMVQILLSLTRYHFRLADHLTIVAESFKYADSDTDKLKDILNVISIDHIDFGKSPTTPMENIIELIKDLPEKIATNKRVN